MSMIDLRQLLWDASFPRENKAEQHAVVTNFLVRFIDVLQIEKRDPDRWEGRQIEDACGAALRGQMHLAMTHLSLAMAPPAERAEEWRSAVSDVDRNYLVAAIERVREAGGDKGNG